MSSVRRRRDSKATSPPLPSRRARLARRAAHRRRLTLGLTTLLLTVVALGAWEQQSTAEGHAAAVRKAARYSSKRYLPIRRHRPAPPTSVTSPVTTTRPTTTTTASTQPAPTTTSSPQPGSSKLRWAPPVLVQPRVVQVPAAGGTLRLADGQDYLVKLPQLVNGVGGVVLLGGRNVVIIGGHLTVTGAPPGASPEQRRALYLKGQTGTVHLEGLLIDNSGGDLSEGINIAAPQAVVQIVNCRIEGVHARDQLRFSDNHPDLIQPWGGVRELRVDRLTGSSDYQGITLEPDYGPIGPVRLSHVNLVGLPTARYLFWQGDARVPVGLEQVWLAPGQGRSLLGSVWPDGQGQPPAVAAADGSTSWPGSSSISGVIRPGRPPGGDFVPAATVGSGYTSPGYQTNSPP